MLRTVLIIVAVLLLQATAHAGPFRQAQPARPVIRARNVVVFNDSLIVQAAPRVEKPDHWEALRASYMLNRYGRRW